MKYNVLDVFCGCGGFSLGFINEGYNIVLATDYDIDALKSYSLNNKNIKTLYADITKLNVKSDIYPLLNNQKVDIIIGGPPCKGMTLSIEENLNTTENTLFLEFIRLVKEIQPKAFVIENIPDIVYLSKGKIKDAIIREFSLLGYCTENFLLDSSKFGIPQYKDRSIFIGVRGKGIEIKIPFPGKQETLSCQAALNDLPDLINNKNNEKYIFEPQNEYQKLMRRNSKKITNHYIPSVPTNIKFMDEERKLKANFPADNLDTRPKHRNQKHYLYERLLTVRECARLQSFPDDYEFYGEENKQFMQVGNAIPPLLAQYIAFTLKKYIDNIK